MFSTSINDNKLLLTTYNYKNQKVSFNEIVIKTHSSKDDVLYMMKLNQYKRLLVNCKNINYLESSLQSKRNLNAFHEYKIRYLFLNFCNKR